MYWGDHLNGWTWAAMGVSMLLFWGLLITAVVLLVRYFTSRDRNPGAHPQPATPEQQLAFRFARGEISEQEFTSRLATLREQARL